MSTWHCTYIAGTVVVYIANKHKQICIEITLSNGIPYIRTIVNHHNICERATLAKYIHIHAIHTYTYIYIPW